MSENQTNIKTLPIVGSFFRPPAKLVCEKLALDTKLTLKPEPENQFDVNAVAVWLNFFDMSHGTMAALVDELPSCGHSIESLEDMKDIHLGYIPKELAKILRERGFEGAEGKFKTSSKGSPMVEFVDHSKKMD